jgi:hypothetical protein
LSDDEFAIENALSGQLFAKWFEYLGKIAIEGLCVAALEKKFIAVTKDENAKPVPLGLVNPVAAGRDLIDAFGKHWKQRRVYGQIHACCAQGTATAEWMPRLARAVVRHKERDSVEFRKYGERSENCRSE